MSNALMYFDTSKVLSGYDAGVDRSYALANKDLDLDGKKMDLQAKDLALQRAKLQLDQLDISNTGEVQRQQYQSQLTPLLLEIQKERARQAQAQGPLFDLQNEQAKIAAQTGIERGQIPIPTVDEQGLPLSVGAQQEAYADTLANSGNPALQREGVAMKQAINAGALKSAIATGNIIEAVKRLNQAGVPTKLENLGGGNVLLNGRAMTISQAIQYMGLGAAKVEEAASKAQAGLVTAAIKASGAEDAARQKFDERRQLAMEAAANRAYEVAYKSAIESGQPATAAALSAEAARNNVLRQYDQSSTPRPVGVPPSPIIRNGSIPPAPVVPRSSGATGSFGITRTPGGDTPPLESLYVAP